MSLCYTSTNNNSHCLEMSLDKLKIILSCRMYEKFTSTWLHAHISKLLLATGIESINQPIHIIEQICVLNVSLVKNG